MMNAIDSRQQFQYEFIAGISLSNESQRFNRINSNIQTNRERRILPNTFQQKQTQSSDEPLEIIGLEFGPKMSLNPSNHQLFIKHTNSSLGSRGDQKMFQLPKRTTFLAGRKAQENVLGRTWTANAPFSSDTLTIVSSQRRSNTSTENSDDKSPMPQRTSTLDSPNIVLKKLSINNNHLSPRSWKKSQPTIAPLGRDVTSIKLPTLLKRTPASMTKPISSAYIQDSSRLHVNRPVLQPTQILPIYTPRRSITLITGQQHLPLLKDRMIKANLAQKASFKCKSPLPYRSDSSLSRSTTAMLTNSQLQMRTFNPLKMDVSLLLNEATRNRLKRLFQQLDTDRDGHLTYPQVQKCLPPNLPRAQETFFRVLYDITGDTTFFGLPEFYATAMLIDMIGKQDAHIWNSLLDDVDFNYYHDDIIELLEEFDRRHSPITSTINFDNLVSLIINRTTNGKPEQVTKELETLFPSIKTIKLTRLEFIALVPVIIYIESCFDQGKALFRFQENSILDLHMRKALFI